MSIIINFILDKVDEEAEDEIALFDNLAKRWVKRKVQVNPQTNYFLLT